MPALTADLKFYVLRNREGLFYRTKGHYGSGVCWVDDINRAKVFSRLAPARGLVTFWASGWPEFGVPEILVLTVTATSVLHEVERVEHSQKKKQEKEEEQKRRRRSWELKSAEMALQAAEKRLDKAKKDV